VVGAIVQKARRAGGLGAEEGAATAGLLGLDHGVKELHSWVVGWDSLALVNEFVESLRLLQRSNVLVLILRQALHKSRHVESIELAASLLLSRWSIKVLSVRVEHAGEAAYEGRTHSIRMES